MKRLLVLEIDCGNKTCGECEYKHDDDCDLYQVSLEEDVLRHYKCIEAEQKAIEMSIASCRKAEAKSIEGRT